MSAERFDLLVAGELNPDAIVVAETIEPEYGQVERLVDDGVLTVGSSGAIVACGAARLGMRTAYVGVVGDDDAGTSCWASCGAEGSTSTPAASTPSGPPGSPSSSAGATTARSSPRPARWPASPPPT